MERHQVQRRLQRVVVVRHGRGHVGTPVRVVAAQLVGLVVGHPEPGAAVGAGDEVDGAGEDTVEREVVRTARHGPRPRREQVVGGQVLRQHGTDACCRETTERQVEVELVQPVGRRQVGQPHRAQRPAEGRFDGALQAGGELGRADAQRAVLQRRRTPFGEVVEQGGAGEVDLFEHLVHQGAELGAARRVGQRQRRPVRHSRLVEARLVGYGVGQGRLVGATLHGLVELDGIGHGLHTAERPHPPGPVEHAIGGGRCQRHGFGGVAAGNRCRRHPSAHRCDADGATRRVGERPQVGQARRRRSGVQGVLQQLAEHTGATRDRGPPQHAAVLGSGECDVEQAAFFAGCLGLRRGEQPCGSARVVAARHPRCVDQTTIGQRGVLHRWLATGHGPQGGAQHHRVLEALGAVRGEHLHGIVVAVDATRHHRIGVVDVAEGSCVGQQAAQGRGRCRASSGGRVQQLGDVLEVGEVSFAAAPRQDASAKAVCARRSEERRDPASRQQGRPVAEQFVEASEIGVGVVGHLGGRVANEPAQRSGASGALRTGPFESTQHEPPLLGGIGVEHAGGTSRGRGDTCIGQGGDHPIGIDIAAHQDGDVASAQRAPASVALVDPRGGTEQTTGDRHEVGHHRPASLGGPELLVACRHHAQLDGRRRAIGAERHRLESARPVRVGRFDRLELDVVGAEGEPSEHPVEALEQRAVGAPVHTERPHAGGHAAGVEVGRQFGTAEAVDRLLGVADQHHRGRVFATDERVLKQMPLDAVGVLELVDEHHPVASTQRCHQRGRLGPHQQIAGVDHHPVERASLRPGTPGDDEVVGLVDQIGCRHRPLPTARFGRHPLRELLVGVVALHLRIG